MISVEVRSSVVLQFDSGNTRLKWRLVTLSEIGVEVLGSGSFFWAELEGEDAGLTQILAATAQAAVGHVWVASVVGAERERRLVNWCCEQLGVKPGFARSTSVLAGVTNGYLQSERLGVDRWLALVGAWNKSRCACLVVDAGSAITVDLVSEQGAHLGGYIAPGLGLMRNSLLGGTDAVKVDELSSLSVKPGLDTGTAVTGALASMVLGLLESAKKQLCSQLFGSSQRTVVLFLTGGDAQALASLLSSCGDFLCELEPGLVFDGLVYWGREHIRVV